MVKRKTKKNLFRLGMLLPLLLCTMHAVASQTVVAKWIFSTGYDVEKKGTTATTTYVVRGGRKYVNK